MYEKLQSGPYVPSVRKSNRYSTNHPSARLVGGAPPSTARACRARFIGLVFRA